jgi:hypothetical protein
MTSNYTPPTVPLPTGKQVTIFSETAFGPATESRRFTIDADTVLLSLYVTSISGGNLIVTAYTETDDNKEVGIATFPTITGPTSELLLKKAAAVMGRIRIQVAATGTCAFEVRARGITIGEASVRILGAVEGQASQLTVGTSTQVVISSGLADRNGLILKNNNISGIMYIGFSPAEATVAVGYPMGPGESLALDVENGTTVYGIGTVPIDVRVLESGR